MKILHIFADWKWTGPAEPVLNLCQTLQQRGHEIVVAYRRPPIEIMESVEKGVKDRDIKGIDHFYLAPLAKIYQLYRIKKIVSDVRGLSRCIDDEGFEIVTVHTTHDHIVGGLAARVSRRHPPIVRMDHKRDSLNADLISRWFLRRYTDGVITFSERGRMKIVDGLGFAPTAVAKVATAVDLARFDPQKAYKDIRSILGIPPLSPVVGIVARFQRYRRTDILLEAISLLIKDVPDVRLLLVGHSSQMKKSVIEPMERLGISSHVVLAGYRMEDYVDSLSCMDVFCLLTPGSDGTARALREAMALGKPVVVTAKGILTELVQDNVTGFVAQETPEGLYRTLLPLVKDGQLRNSVGKAARKVAQTEFRLERQAEEVEAFYQRILKMVSVS